MVKAIHQTNSGGGGKRKCDDIYMYRDIESRDIYVYMDVSENSGTPKSSNLIRFPKIGVPQNGWFIMENSLKWMIWGYP